MRTVESHAPRRVDARFNRGARTIVAALGLTRHCRTTRFGGGFQRLGYLAARRCDALAGAGGPCKAAGQTTLSRQMADPLDDYLVRPDPQDARLTERVRGIDHTGAPIETAVVVERALTIFLNAQEIVTAMTINDYPAYLALGYLLNQNMLQPEDVVTGVEDRKSTRLNSSHVEISYAVFCLKK